MRDTTSCYYHMRKAMAEHYPELYEANAKVYGKSLRAVLKTFEDLSKLNDYLEFFKYRIVHDLYIKAYHIKSGKTIDNPFSKIDYLDAVDKYEFICVNPIDALVFEKIDLTKAMLRAKRIEVINEDTRLTTAIDNLNFILYENVGKSAEEIVHLSKSKYIVGDNDSFYLIKSDGRYARFASIKDGVIRKDVNEKGVLPLRIVLKHLESAELKKENDRELAELASLKTKAAQLEASISAREAEIKALTKERKPKKETQC